MSSNKERGWVFESDRDGEEERERGDMLLVYINFLQLKILIMSPARRCMHFTSPLWLNKDGDDIKY